MNLKINNSFTSIFYYICQNKHLKRYKTKENED